MSTLLHVVVYWWQLAAFMRLKLYHPQLERLYVVPGGLPGAWLLCCLKAPVLLLLLATCSDWQMLLGAMLLNMALGLFVVCRG